MQSDSERKQPQNVNYQHYNDQLTGVIETLGEAPKSPQVTQAIEQLHTITENLRTTKDPRSFNPQQYNTQLTEAIHALEEAPNSPKVAHGLRQLREITEQMRTARAA